MFSFFKSKSKSPLAHKANVEWVNVIAEFSVKMAIKRLKYIDEWLLVINNDYLERIIEDNTNALSAIKRNATYELWLYNLRLIYYCLEQNANEYDNGDKDVFLIPVLKEIIQLSKHYLQKEIEKEFGIKDGVDGVGYGELFDDFVLQKLMELLGLTAVPKSTTPLSINKKTSALDLAIFNTLKALGVEISNEELELRLINNQIIAASEFKDICIDAFKDMRRIMDA